MLCLIQIYKKELPTEKDSRSECECGSHCVKKARKIENLKRQYARHVKQQQPESFAFVLLWRAY